ncbi:MAG: hypothetical protein ACI8WB_000722 [Phenylobacterium sp.]|jgi:hypothetical protein
MKELTLTKLILIGLPTMFVSQAYAQQATPTVDITTVANTQVTSASGQYIQLQESGRILTISGGDNILTASGVIIDPPF